jgi:hypothetical protein
VHHKAAHKKYSHSNTKSFARKNRYKTMKISAGGVVLSLALFARVADA